MSKVIKEVKSVERQKEEGKSREARESHSNPAASGGEHHNTKKH
jgi:hypothetical protein